MPAYDARPGRFEFTDDIFTHAGRTFDLADIDALTAADHGLRLRLYTGETLLFTHLGKVYDRAVDELRQAWLTRLVKALMLSDLPLVDVFTSREGEVRVFEGGLAVLPDDAAPFHVRMADIDRVTFDADAYEVRLETRRGRFAFGKLAKRTDVFKRAIEDTLAKLDKAAAAALTGMKPWREGRLTPWAPEHDAAIAPDQKPFADHLASLADRSKVRVAFKRVYSVDEESPTPVAFSFYYPIGDLVAQEVVSAAGSATYWFRTGDLEELNAGLSILNFRREPVYLPEDDPRFERYRPAMRRIPELRAVRAAFVDRSIHRSLDDWKAQIKVR